MLATSHQLQATSDQQPGTKNMFGNIGMSELLIILIVVLLLFGPKKLPELARGLGRGIQEFKKAADDVKKELTVEDDFKKLS